MSLPEVQTGVSVGPVFDLKVAGAEVRPWRRGDETSLAAHANNRNVWLHLRDGFPSPYTLEDARRWIALANSFDPATNFAIAVGGDAVGGIGFTLGADVYRLTAEIGFWLGEAFWGRGIVTAALKVVTDHAFATFGLTRLHAGVFEWNAASMRVLEKAGYVREARLPRSAIKDGKIIDTYLYGTVRG